MYLIFSFIEGCEERTDHFLMKDYDLAVKTTEQLNSVLPQFLHLRQVEYPIWIKSWNETNKKENFSPPEKPDLGSKTLSKSDLMKLPPNERETALVEFRKNWEERKERVEITFKVEFAIFSKKLAAYNLKYDQKRMNDQEAWISKKEDQILSIFPEKWREKFRQIFRVENWIRFEMEEYTPTEFEVLEQ